MSLRWRGGYRGLAVARPSSQVWPLNSAPGCGLRSDRPTDHKVPGPALEGTDTSPPTTIRARCIRIPVAEDHSASTPVDPPENWHERFASAIALASAPERKFLLPPKRWAQCREG